MKRLASFLAVGASGVPIDMAVTLVMSTAVGLLPAQLLGWAIAASWNYQLNARLVWDGELTVSEWGRYLATDSGRLALRLAVVALLAGSVPDLVATAGGIGTAALAGFVGFDRIVFSNDSAAPQYTQHHD